MVGPLKFHDYILTELQKDVENFKRGNLRYFSKNWYRYIKDKYILDIITNGLKLDLKQLPTQNSRSSYSLSSKHCSFNLFQWKLKNCLKNQLLFIVPQRKVDLFLVFSLGTKKMAIKA